MAISDRSRRSCYGTASNRRALARQGKSRPTRGPRLTLEALESRLLLDSGGILLQDDTLLVTGGTGPDAVLIQQTGPLADQQVVVTLNGATQNFAAAAVARIQVLLDSGDDFVTLDESLLPVAAPLTCDGGDGANTLAVLGTAGGDAFGLTAGTVTLVGAGTLTYTRFQILSLDAGAGTDSLAADVQGAFGGSLSLAGVEAVTLQFTGEFQGSLAVNAPGRVDALTVTGGVAAGAVLTATHFGNVAIDTLSGRLTAVSGSLVHVSIGSVTATGLLEATEIAGDPDTGLLRDATIGVIAGRVQAGAIVDLTVETVAAGAAVEAAGHGTTSNVSIGTLSGSLTAPEDANPGSGIMTNTSIGTISTTGSLSTGSISGMTVGNMAGTVAAAGHGTTSNVSIGTLSGSIGVPEDANPGSGIMSNTSIGTITTTGSLSTGSISGMTVGNMAGTVAAAGHGTTSNVSIGTLSGSMVVPEDANPGSGIMTSTSIGTISTTGYLSTGSISGMTVGTMAGTVAAAGHGTTSNVTIGTLSGSVSVPKDDNPGSGTMTNTSIGLITPTGSVSTGTISGMSIGTMAGTVAAGQGTASNVTIGVLSGTLNFPVTTDSGTAVMANTSISNVTSTGAVTTGSISGMTVGSLAGSVTAAGPGTASNVSIGTLSGSLNVVEGQTSGSGVISNTSIGNITPTGSVSTGTISGMTVGNMAGTVAAAGWGRTDNMVIGTLSGQLSVPVDPGTDGSNGSGVMTNTSIGTITPTGSVATGAIVGMTVGVVEAETTPDGPQRGSITASGPGAIQDITIGTLCGEVSTRNTATSRLGTLTGATIGTLDASGIITSHEASAVTVATLAGTMTFTGRLEELDLDTLEESARLQAGHFSIVRARHAPTQVQMIEAGVTRTIQVAPRTSGGAAADYSFYYDGTGSGNPWVVVQLAGGAAGADHDLDVLTDTVGAGAGLDLAGLYVASGKAGVRNVVVGGDLAPAAVSPAALTYFGLPATTPRGIHLPQDTIAVAVAGRAPHGSIAALSVQAVAAGWFGNVPAASATSSDAQAVLAAGTALAQAAGAYQLLVGTGPLAQFLVTGPGTAFDSRPLVFSQRGGDGHPVSVAEVLTAAGSGTAVSSLVFTGQGGSLTTAQPILSSITARPGSTLGDLVLSSPDGIVASITADAITGTVAAPNGNIAGVIRTTVGDLGSAVRDAQGRIVDVTAVQAAGGLTSTGQVIAAGSLVSRVSLANGLDGIIAAGRDIGVIQLDADGLAPAAPAPLTRFGGIAVANGLSGQVVALGNIFGDIKVTGGLSGRIAAGGREEFGLSRGTTFSRTGILGGMSINGGIASTGAVVSRGLIGDDGTNNTLIDAAGTQLNTTGAVKAIVASGEDINFGRTAGSWNSAAVFENAAGANWAAIDAIFTDEGVALTVADLDLIVSDLQSLTVDSAGNLSGSKA